MGRIFSPRIEATSYGYAPELCGVGSDSSGSQIGAGLRVPTLATTSAATRYLFVGASAHVASGRCVRVAGIRQLVEIGVDTNNGNPPLYPVTKTVTTPDWHFADSGPVCFSLRLHRKRRDLLRSAGPASADSLAYLFPNGGAPSLVYSAITLPGANTDINGASDNYTTLTAYTPPWATQAMGTPVGQLGDIRDVRFPWGNPTKQTTGPIVRGPGLLVLWISVWQTNPATRARLTIPAAAPLAPGIPEESFVYWADSIAGPAAIYWRVGGALCLEDCDDPDEAADGATPCANGSAA